MRRRNLRTLDLGRDRDVKVDRLFQVFHEDPVEKSSSSRRGLGGPSGRRGQAKGQDAPMPREVSGPSFDTSCASSMDADQEEEEEEALGFLTDTTADAAVMQELRAAKRLAQPMLTQEEQEAEAVEAKASWRVERSARAGFKVFRCRATPEDASRSSPDATRRRSRSRGHKRSRRQPKMDFADL
mmetsp:Transcript_55647/g.124177  ORF Transcript_55647/g.124177 Transcript_55647/m.124177 type:complete len:184 (+) Transcript_55647:21-572(+)